MPNFQTGDLCGLEETTGSQKLFFQSPEKAWEHVEAKDAIEGRNILPETLISQYFVARDNLNRLKNQLYKDISVDLLLKEIDGSNKLQKVGIDNLDYYISEKYSIADIQNLIEIKKG